MFLFDSIFALAVRGVLVIHSLLVVWLATSLTGNKHYWLLAIAIVGMIIETLITFVKNKAKESKW